MKINIQRNGDEVVVALNGELDTVTTAQMGEELRVYQFVRTAFLHATETS